MLDTCLSTYRNSLHFSALADDCALANEQSVLSISGSIRSTPIRDVDKIQVDAQPPEIADTSAILINPEVEEDDVITPMHKRKRTSINYNIDDSLSFDGIRDSPTAAGPVIKRSKTLAKSKVRGVIIGVWRDSSEPIDADKHVIFGFIDIHDRLRTRIYGMNRKGEELVGNLPTGPGGCWVTFPKIKFDTHLKSLSPAQIKEYVKIRVQDVDSPTSKEHADELDALAVARAKLIVFDDTASPGIKAIVHRPSARKSLPTPTLRKTPSFQAVNVSNEQATKGSFYDGKPSGVLLGYWVDSDSPSRADKHAVYGTIGGSGFRIKVQRVTRDGRYVDGNFPLGTGTMWIGYDKVVFEPHLARLTRPEIKEYVRIRLIEQEQNETDNEQILNETKAIAQAKENVAAKATLDDKASTPRVVPKLEMETRHSARAEQKAQAKQRAETDAMIEKNKEQDREVPRVRHGKTRKSTALNEANIQGVANNKLKKNISQLNRIWEAQQSATSPQAEASPPPPASEEVKYHHGIKYEKKQTGFFQGKLVSAAQILTIDGEDYVEYRVLTKPAF